MDEKMIAHDPNKPITQGWYLDKRISVAHIVATLSLAVALGSVVWAIETRVTVVEQRVTTHEAVTKVEIDNIKEDRLHEQRLATERFGEIKMQLIRIEEKVDRHAENARHPGTP